MITVTGLYNNHGGSNYNAVVSVQDVTDESDIGNEPVTLQEVKDYLRLEGFVDVDASTADDLSDFDFDDDLIEDIIIPGARQLMEEKAGISLIPKTLEAILTNLCGMIEIPFGPVRSVTSLFDSETTEILAANYTVVGNHWKYLKHPCYKHLKITYEAGYLAGVGQWKLPAALKLDLLRLCAYMYENRGDDPAIEKFSSQIISKYSRNTPII